MNFGFSLMILILAFGIIVIPSILFHAAVQPLFLISWVAVWVILSASGFSASRLQDRAAESVKKAYPVIMIMLAAGAMVGVLNLCGTLPYLTMLGLRVISPALVLPVTFAVVFFTSYFTGTVFGAIGTVGVIFLSIAQSMQVTDSLTVGAIFAGGFMGYVASPLGELLPLSASLTGEEQGRVFAKLSELLLVPSVVTGILFWILNLRLVRSGEILAMSMDPMEVVDGWYAGPVLILPFLILLVMLILRKPTVVSLTVGAITGAVLAMTVQGRSFAEAVTAMWTGPVLSAGRCANLFARGGMQTMSGTVLLFIGSFGLFGLLEEAGVLEVVFGRVKEHLNGRLIRQLVVFVTAFLMTVFCASATCAVLFTMNFFDPMYREKKWDPGEMILTVMAGSVIFSSFVPWHSNCVTPVALLGIDPAVRLPAMFYPWVTLVWLIILWVFPFFIKKKL